MSDNKKYYYIRLKENFFDSDEVVALESMPDGYLYSNILLKLYLRSLRGDGRLMINDCIPYNSNMLSQVTHHPIAVIEKALQIFMQLGLIEILDNGAIFMLHIQEFIGQSGSEGDRKRRYRARIKEEQKLLETGQMSTIEVDKCRDIRPLEIRDKSIEIIYNNPPTPLKGGKRKTVVKFDGLTDDERLLDGLNKFAEYRLEIKKPFTKSQLEPFMKKLAKLGDNSVDKEIAILEQSQSNGWQGIFALQEERDGRSKNSNWSQGARAKKEFESDSKQAEFLREWG